MQKKILKSSVGLFDWQEFARRERALIERCEERCQAAVKSAQARLVESAVPARFYGHPEFQKLRQVRHSRPRKYN